MRQFLPLFYPYFYHEGTPRKPSKTKIKENQENQAKLRLKEAKKTKQNQVNKQIHKKGLVSTPARGFKDMGIRAPPSLVQNTVGVHKWY
jgi:hypothetical protein